MTITPGRGSAPGSNISVDACNGLVVSPPYGSISVGGGLASFSAPYGQTFPYIVAGPPTRHPFPSSGDFTLELRMRYDVIAVAGSGVMVFATSNADPVGTNSPLPPGGQILQIWNDSGGLRGKVLGGGDFSIGDGAAFHDYQLVYAGGAYSLVIDGAQIVGPIASALPAERDLARQSVCVVAGRWRSVDGIQCRLRPRDISAAGQHRAARHHAFAPRRRRNAPAFFARDVDNADSFAIDWRRCSSSGCQTVGHNSTYTLTDADLGSRMRLDVTAFNANGSAGASSSLTNPVEAAPPLNSHLPTISGSFATGSTLTASTGSWSGTDTVMYGYQWLRCDSGGCAQIGSATGSTYVVQQSDIGHTLRVRVTAGNGAGIASAASAAFPSGSSVSPPRSIALPGTSGTATVGHSLQAGTATWTGTGPITLSYQWRRCSTLAATDCAPITGATARSYLLTSADQGLRMRVVVIARNGVLVNRVTSYASSVVTAG